MPTNDKPRRLFQLLFALLAIGVAVALFVFFLSTRKKPEQHAVEERSVLVEVVALEAQDYDITIHGHGTVAPARDVQLAPQVSGRVAWISEKLTVGEIVREGDELFRIDDTDYALAVEQAQTQVRSAESQLEIEAGRKRVAEREWQLFEQRRTTTGSGRQRPEDAESADVDESTAPDATARDAGDERASNPALATREPQLRAARAHREAADAQLHQARSNLRRTTVRAPFDAYVDSRSIELGAWATPQAPVAHLVGIERFWVEVSIKASALPWLDIPRLRGGQGSPATIRYDLGSETIERDGNVLRLRQSLDARGQMARLIIEVPDPLKLRDGGTNAEREPSTDEGETASELPLLVGAYVDVHIKGPTLPNVVAVPRSALRAAHSVWRVGDDSRLEMVTIDPVWTDDDAVYVPANGALRPGDRVVTSNIASPVDGLKLRVRGDDAKGNDAPSRDADAPGGRR